MIIDVILTAGAVTSADVINKNVAVIDIFRATSVIVEALYNGARAVVPAVQVSDARALAHKFPAGVCLLGGERNAEKIEGFDKGNSPASYVRSEVEGKTVILTTTNGTRAIYNSRHARTIFIASFLNITAACRRLAAEGRDIVLVCSGRHDRFTAEDGMCAGSMVDHLQRHYTASATDLALAMRDLFRCSGGGLKERLSETLHYKFLMEHGYGNDIDYCLQEDIYDTVPYYNKNGEIII